MGLRCLRALRLSLLSGSHLVILMVVVMLTHWMRWRMVVRRLDDDAEHVDQVL